MNKYRLMESASMVGIKTIKELSKASGIPVTSLSEKINGHRSFDLKEVNRLCLAIGIEDGAKKAEIFLS